MQNPRIHAHLFGLLAWRTFWAASALFVAQARADVPPPEVWECNGKAVGASCTLQEVAAQGAKGTCRESQCTRGGLMGTTTYACVECLGANENILDASVLDAAIATTDAGPGTPLDGGNGAPRDAGANGGIDAGPAHDVDAANGNKPDAATVSPGSESKDDSGCSLAHTALGGASWLSGLLAVLLLRRRRAAA